MEVNTYKTEVYAKRLDGLRDQHARDKVLTRVRRLLIGNPGDHKGLGGGLIEMCIDYGAGLRVYYAWHGSALVLLLAGGDKSTQSRDVKAARQLLTSSIGEIENES